MIWDPLSEIFGEPLGAKSGPSRDLNLKPFLRARKLPKALHIYNVSEAFRTMRRSPFRSPKREPRRSPNEARSGTRTGLQIGAQIGAPREHPWRPNPPPPQDLLFHVFFILGSFPFIFLRSGGPKSTLARFRGARNGPPRGAQMDADRGPESKPRSGPKSAPKSDPEMDPRSDPESDPDLEPEIGPK